MEKKRYNRTKSDGDIGDEKFQFLSESERIWKKVNQNLSLFWHMFQKKNMTLWHTVTDMETSVL